MSAEDDVGATVTVVDNFVLTIIDPCEVTILDEHNELTVSNMIGNVYEGPTT